MATSTKRKRRLWDAYAFPMFRPQPTVRGVFGELSQPIALQSPISRSGVMCRLGALA